MKSYGRAGRYEAHFKSKRGHNSAKYSNIVKTIRGSLYFIMIYLCTKNKMKNKQYQKMLMLCLMKVIFSLIWPWASKFLGHRFVTTIDLKQKLWKSVHWSLKNKQYLKILMLCLTKVIFSLIWPWPSKFWGHRFGLLPQLI